MREILKQDHLLNIYLSMCQLTILISGYHLNPHKKNKKNKKREEKKETNPHKTSVRQVLPLFCKEETGSRRLNFLSRVEFLLFLLYISDPDGRILLRNLET